MGMIYKFYRIFNTINYKFYWFFQSLIYKFCYRVLSRFSC